MKVAKTILKQLGGNRFICMTGAKNFLSGGADLSFSVGKNPKRVSHIKIELTRHDTYTVRFFKKAKRDPVLRMSIGVEIFSVREDVYFDRLPELIESETGLLTSLAA